VLGKNRISGGGIFSDLMISGSEHEIRNTENELGGGEGKIERLLTERRRGLWGLGYRRTRLPEGNEKGEKID